MNNRIRTVLSTVSLLVVLSPLLVAAQTPDPALVQQLQAQLQALQAQIQAVQRMRASTPSYPPSAPSTPPAVMSGSFTIDLYFGMKNSTDVTRLQQFLTAQNVYSGPITGNFYAMTKAAVMAYQRKNGVSATGYFGPKSRGVANASSMTMSKPTSLPMSAPGLPPPPVSGVHAMSNAASLPLGVPGIPPPPPGLK